MSVIYRTRFIFTAPSAHSIHQACRIQTVNPYSQDMGGVNIRFRAWISKFSGYQLIHTRDSIPAYDRLG